MRNQGDTDHVTINQFNQTLRTCTERFSGYVTLTIQSNTKHPYMKVLSFEEAGWEYGPAPDREGYLYGSVSLLLGGRP